MPCRIFWSQTTYLRKNEFKNFSFGWYIKTKLIWYKHVWQTSEPSDCSSGCHQQKKERTTRDLEGWSKFRKKWKIEECRKDNGWIGNRKISTVLMKGQAYITCDKLQQLNNTLRFENIDPNQIYATVLLRNRILKIKCGLLRWRAGNLAVRTKSFIHCCCTWNHQQLKSSITKWGHRKRKNRSELNTTKRWFYSQPARKAKKRK